MKEQDRRILEELDQIRTALLLDTTKNRYEEFHRLGVEACRALSIEGREIIVREARALELELPGSTTNICVTCAEEDCPERWGLGTTKEKEPAGKLAELEARIKKLEELADKTEVSGFTSYADFERNIKEGRIKTGVPVDTREKMDATIEKEVARILETEAIDGARKNCRGLSPEARGNAFQLLKAMLTDEDYTQDHIKMCASCLEPHCLHRRII